MPAVDQDSDHVLLGRVVKVHGTRGEVKIFPDSGQPENFKQYRTLYVESPAQEQPARMDVRQVRVQHKLVLVQFADIDDRTAAGTLVGSRVWLARSDLPRPEPGRYYLHEMEGSRAVDQSGAVLGYIDGFLQNCGQDVMRIRGEEREYLVPLHQNLIAALNPGEVVLRVPPGLLDIND